MAGWGTIISGTQSALAKHTAALARLQEMIASGSRVRRASDAPADAFRMLGLRTETHTLGAYRNNIGTVSDSLSVASSVVGQISEALARVRTLAAQGATGTYSAASREALAHEIDSLLGQVVSLANTRHRGQYLFAGSNSAAPPYELERDGEVIVGVRYAGSYHAVEVPVSRGVKYAGVLVGEDVFRSAARRPPEFHGATGAAPGVGTPSVRGESCLTLTHEATTYLGASGVAPAADSATADAILGNGHTLEIDVPAGTLRLDGGEAVSFDRTETRLAVTAPGGETVYVDTTGIVDGFVGTVGIQATGRMSLNGSSPVVINFADPNQVVIDWDNDRRVLYVDATGIVRTGVEPVTVEGTYDLFGAMMSVRDALLNAQGLSSEEHLDAINRGIGALTEVSDGLTKGQVMCGARLGALASLDESLENLEAFASDQTAALENADVVQVATELARRQTLYEMTLTSAAHLLRLSLLDYL